MLSCRVSSLRSIRRPKVFYQIFPMIPTMSSPSMPHVSEDRDDTGIPVTCGKCSETFQTDSDYVMHYNEMHADSSSDQTTFKRNYILAKHKEKTLADLHCSDRRKRMRSFYIHQDYAQINGLNKKKNIPPGSMTREY